MIIIKRTFEKNHKITNGIFTTDIWSMLPKSYNLAPLSPFIMPNVGDSADVEKFYRRRFSINNEFNYTYGDGTALFVYRDNLLLYAPLFMAKGIKVFTIAKYMGEYFITDMPKMMMLDIRFGIQKVERSINIIPIVMSILDKGYLTYTPCEYIPNIYKESAKVYLTEMMEIIMSNLNRDIYNFMKYGVRGETNVKPSMLQIIYNMEDLLSVISNAIHGDILDYQKFTFMDYISLIIALYTYNRFMWGSDDCE